MIAATQGRSRLLGVGKSEGAVLGYKGTMGVVDVLTALAVGNRGVEDPGSSAVHDEVHLVPEGAVQPLVEIGERLLEQIAREERRSCLPDQEQCDEVLSARSVATQDHA